MQLGFCRYGSAGQRFSFGEMGGCFGANGGIVRLHHGHAELELDIGIVGIEKQRFAVMGHSVVEFFGVGLEFTQPLMAFGEARVDGDGTGIDV